MVMLSHEKILQVAKCIIIIMYHKKTYVFIWYLIKLFAIPFRKLLPYIYNTYNTHRTVACSHMNMDPYKQDYLSSTLDIWCI